MHIRLLLLAILAIAVYYVGRRVWQRVAGDPRLRAAAAQMGPHLLRGVLSRAAVPLLLRALRHLRLFF